MSTTKTDLHESYLALAKEIAHQAGTIMLKYFDSTPVTWKKDDTPLTRADTEINKLVIDTIRSKYPDHDILGEEQSALENNSNHVWVCDPIDGTGPYAHGIPTAIFSLALVKDGVVELAVCYDPFLKKLYSALQGHGAYVNNKKMHVNNITDMQRTYTILDGWNKAPFDILPLLDRFAHHRANVLKLGSIVYSGMLVARGNVGAIVFAGSAPHDGASIKLIVEEAGGRVSDLYGKEQRYDKKIRGFIATNGVLHEHLLKQVQHVLECHPVDEHKDHEQEF